MKRRSFVRLAVGAAVGSVGCLGGGEEGPTGATRMAVGDDRGRSRLSVSTVETFEYAVRLNDLGADPTGGVTRFADLTDRECEVVRTAVAGTYRTRDPAPWLREFASATEFVERDGVYYRLDDTFPTYRVTAAAVPRGEVAGETATYGEYERAVTREDYVATGLLRVARREAVELSYVWPALRAFFEAYDAVRYRGEVVSFSVAVADADPPHGISATEVPVSATVDGSVWNASAAPEPTRRLVRRAGRARGAYGFDRAPPGLLDNLRSHRYVHLDGTFYTTYVETRGAVPVSVSAGVRDGRLRLSARNEGDRELDLATGPPRPFGVVRCRSRDAPDARSRPLWTDAYAESDRVRTRGRDVEAVNDVGVASTLAPGESVAERYAVPADLPDGEYVVADSLGVADVAGAEDEGSGDDESEDGGDGSSTVRYRVGFSVG